LKFIEKKVFVAIQGAGGITCRVSKGWRYKMGSLICHPIVDYTDKVVEK
jgi:hypothetical protein